ncbi:MAG: high-potential iron-sulfur protein [Halieaceae bacterium]|jgi:hypothetical protein|nr:high-potential iron-sulfur protein [Halieaceae bacterium]
MNNSKQFSRRDVLAAGGAIIATSLMGSRAFAADKVTEDDPTAVALGYKHDATAVDTSAWAKKAADTNNEQVCSSCALYMDQGDGWGACSIFQGRLVNANGWCNAWIAK